MAENNNKTGMFNTFDYKLEYVTQTQSPVPVSFPAFLNGLDTPVRNIKLNHQDVYDDCGVQNVVHSAIHGCDTIAKLHVRPMWHGHALKCQAFDHVDDVFIRCDAEANTVCGAFAEDGKWMSRVPQLGTTYDPVRARKWNVCDMHTPVRAWLPLLLFFLVMFPTPRS